MNVRRLTDEQRKEHLKAYRDKFYSIEKNRREKIRQAELSMIRGRIVQKYIKTLSFKERADYMLNLCKKKYGV